VNETDPKARLEAFDNAPADATSTSKPSTVGDAFYAATVVQIIGLAFIIARSLFPEPPKTGK